MASIDDTYVKGLNPPQREAALRTEGPVLVLAGAGSGKTRVITRRIAHIIANQLARPQQILAVTFTNKAANEMRERVAELVGPKAARAVFISTFHSFCLRVLRKHCEAIGYRKNFSIASESDSRTLLRRVVDALPSNDSFSPGIFQAEISLFKNMNRDPSAEGALPVATATQAKYSSYMGDVYEAYASSLRAANAMDFDDLMLQTLRLWREHPDIAERCRGAFRYVMVDEYQDTNQVQLELVRALVAEHRNLCVVGDDDQSIYAWRGADSRIILDFEKHYPEAAIITLDQNYRSTGTILKAANAVIQNNGTRREKKLWSDLGEGRPLDWFVVADEEAEAREALGYMKHIQSRSGARWNDFAFLYRSNQQSKTLEIALRQAGIPYVVIGGQDFFERTEVKDIISYLKVLANPRDEAAFLRVVNMPRRGIGDQTLHTVHDICLRDNCSLGQALAQILKQGPPRQAEFLDAEAGFSPNAEWSRTEQGIREFLSLLKTFRERLKTGEGGLKAIVEDLVLAIDYHGELQRSCKNAAQLQARWQNVELVLKTIGDYEAANEKATLASFLDESHLNSDGMKNSREERRREGVTLMTIHSSKGLEFPFVFLMGCEDGLIPHQKSIEDNNLDEERRLFYVALTRGRRHVALFEALTRTKGGKERSTKPSRFFQEIPPELLRQQIRAARDGMAVGNTEQDPEDIEAP